MADFTELQLEDGTSVRFVVAAADAVTTAPEQDDGLPEGMGRSVPVARGGAASASFAVEALRTALQPLRPLLQEVHNAVTASDPPPRETSVTFGVQIGHDLKLGIVGGSGQAHLTISATWQPAAQAD